MSWFSRFRHWAGHPLWSAFVTALAMPLFIMWKRPFWLPGIGFLFGLVHESLQYFWCIPHCEETFNLRDVFDFTIGGLVMSILIWITEWLRKKRRTR
jgi:hypothetical protein